MKKYLGVLAGLGFCLISSGSALAESGGAMEGSDRFESICRRYAEEDQIPQAEMGRYVADCIQDFQTSTEEPAPMMDEPGMETQPEVEPR